MTLDLELLHDAERLKTGALVHDLNAMTNRYKSAKTPEGFAEAGANLRKFVEAIKRRNRNAPTCQHTAMMPHVANGYRFLFCDDCGYVEDAPFEKEVERG